MKSLFHPKRLKLDIKNFKTFFLLKGKWKKKTNHRVAEDI